MKTCENCGSRVYEGFCTWCDEEHFIAGQYREDGESVSQLIADIESDQVERKRTREIERLSTWPK